MNRIAMQLGDWLGAPVNVAFGDETLMAGLHGVLHRAHPEFERLAMGDQEDEPSPIFMVHGGQEDDRVPFFKVPPSAKRIPQDFDGGSGVKFAVAGCWITVVPEDGES